MEETYQVMFPPPITGYDRIECIDYPTPSKLPAVPAGNASIGMSARRNAIASGDT